MSLPTPARGMQPERYLAQLRRALSQSGAEHLVLEGRFAPMLAEAALDVEVISFEELDVGGHPTATFEPPGKDEIAFIQYSSGSTGEPHGCALTTGAIAAQLDRLVESLGVSSQDRGVSWLPLSHDMGLFGSLMLSYVTGGHLLLSTPERFLRSPRTWLEDCARIGANVTPVPNFALELAVRAVGSRSKIDPFPMKRCIVGGERIDASTLEKVASVLGPIGLTSRSLMPAYGLAEAVLAVTLTPVDSDPMVLSVDAEALAAGEFHPGATGVPSKRIVGSGLPLRDVEVRIDGPEGGLGEICIRTPSLAKGYVGDSQRTAERFCDGELRTGDSGFLHDGHLFVQGRLDDLIVVAGRNVWARDLEAVISAEPGIRSGNCVVVEVPEDTPYLVAIAEPDHGAEDFEQLARSTQHAARKAAGIRIDECVLVPRGTLPKTPSGKVQRFRCLELLQTGELESLARISL